MILLKTKTISLIIIAIIISVLVKNKNDNIIIPKESIRIRIIANSNNKIDVNEKFKVKKSVEKELYSLLKNVKNVNEARSVINNNLNRLNLVIEDTTNLEYDVKFACDNGDRQIDVDYGAEFEQVLKFDSVKEKEE